MWKTAADLLVEEDLAGELVDALIGTDGELAQVTRAGVAIQFGIEVFLVFIRGGFHTLAVLEFEAHVGDLEALVHGRVGEVGRGRWRCSPPAR